MNKIIIKVKSFFQTHSWAPYLLFFVVIFSLYGRSIFFDYSYLDDQSLILNHADILERANFEEIFLNDVFFGVGKAYYRPLLTWSFVLDWHLGGGSIHFFHFSNLLYHFLATALLFYLLNISAVKRRVSLFLTLVFAIHPALVQAVVWVPGRNDSLAAIFIFSALIFFDRFLNFEKIRYLFLLSISFLAALLTKESAILLPPLALLWAFVFRKERLNSFNLIVSSSAVITTALIWYLLRRLVVYSQSLLEIWHSFLSSLFSPAVFLGKIFFPFNLSAYTVLVDINWLYAYLAIAFLIFSFFIFRPRKPWISFFGLFWFWWFLLFASLRPDGLEKMNIMEHRLYIPMFGFFIFVSNWRWPSFMLKRKRMIEVMAVLVLLFLAVLSFRYSNNFRDRMIFWQSVVNSSPHSALAYRNLGVIYYSEEKFDEAEAYFYKSLEISPDEPMANNNLAAIYMYLGNLEKAESFLEKELAINPYYDVAFYNLGMIYYRRQDYAKAEFYWQKTLEINPRYIQAAYYLNELYAEAKE